MLASLPMYDLPELRETTDSFWSAVAKAYGVKGGLSRAADLTAAWRNPDLLFSQTCGYPFTHAFADTLKYLATPHYAADGCDGAHYRSIVFARDAAPLESFRGKVAAYNTPDSMSGMLALKLAFEPLAGKTPFFARSVETGGHINSLLALQQQRADVAAIDCVTVALLRKHRPAALDGLVEIARSPLVPGLPFVTRDGDITRLRANLTQLCSPRHPWDAMLLSGVSVLEADAYQIIPRLESSLASSGIVFNTQDEQELGLRRDD